MLTKVEQNGLIGATGYQHVWAILHQPANELVSLESFRFRFPLPDNNRSSTLIFLNKERKCLALSSARIRGPDPSSFSKRDPCRHGSVEHWAYFLSSEIYLFAFWSFVNTLIIWQKMFHSCRVQVALWENHRGDKKSYPKRPEGDTMMSYRCFAPIGSRN
jgi:hypothetical protein